MNAQNRIFAAYRCCLAVLLILLGIQVGCGGDGSSSPGGPPPSGPPPVKATLTVQKSGSGSGTVSGGGINCGSTCSASGIAQGTVVTLTASPDAGSTFGNWIGCDTASGTTCTVTVSANRLVTATFSLVGAPIPTLTVQKSGSGSGTVSGGGINCGSTCSASGIAPGTVVTLTAAPDAGSTFGNWTGCDTASGTTCTVTMNANRLVTATFTTVYTLTVFKGGSGSGAVGGGGINCGSTCSASGIAPGTLVTLTAAPDAYSIFGSWGGCDSTSGTTCTVTMNAARLVTATFDATSYSLAVQRNGSGSGAVSGGGINCGSTCSAPGIAPGTVVTLTASPDVYSTFAYWSGCDTASGTTCTVTLNVNRLVTATFNSNAYALIVSKSGSGSGTVSGGGINCGVACVSRIVYGTVVTLTAAPDVDSTFGNWGGCDTASGTTCTVTMNASRSVTATFNATAYTLTTWKGGSGSGTVSGGGINCGSTCSVSRIAPGTVVTLTAAPDANSTLGYWGRCDTASGTTCTVTMNANRSVTATFNATTQTLAVQKTGSGSGTVSGGGINCGSTCSSGIAPGTLVTLTASPDASSTFGYWSGCDMAIGLTCAVTMNAARSVTAIFNPVGATTHTLTVQVSGLLDDTVSAGGINWSSGGTDCGSACSISGIAQGTVMTLTASPGACSTVVHWSGCDTASGAICTVTMNADRSVSASFDSPFPCI